MHWRNKVIALGSGAWRFSLASLSKLGRLIRNHLNKPVYGEWPRINGYFTGFLILYVLGSLSFFLSPLPGRRDSDIFLLSRHQELIFEYSNPDLGIQKAPGRIPDTFIRLLLLAEDQNYYHHGGLDFQAIIRAFLSNVREGRIVSGASTIPQQYVRIAFKHRMPESALLRKPVEALYAIKVSSHWSKDELLDRYIQNAPLGRNRKGFPAAARYYFDKDLSLLSCEEQSLLIVLLRRTSMNLEAMKNRMQHLFLRTKSEMPILAEQCGWQSEEHIKFPSSFRFLDAGDHSTEETESVSEASNSEIQISGYPHSAPHLGVYLFHNLDVRGEVLTELDNGLQTHIQSIIQAELSVLEDKGANQAAVIVLERGSEFWNLRAMIGSSDFEGQDGQVNGALAIHDAGSVLKPFLYALAVQEMGLRPGHLIDDSEYVITDSIRKETYAPRNHDLKFSGTITVREALAGSRNIPAVRLIERLGAQRFYDLLKSAGFEHMQEPARDYGPSLALGTGGATLFEVTLLYGALAAEGEMLPVQIAHSPVLRFGQRKQLFRTDTALLIRHILSDREARRGSFGPRSFLDFPFDVAAKTGTSKDFRDSWAVGYTTNHVVGVWVGNFRSEPTLGVSGARGAGRIMHQVMRMLYENSDSRFHYPDSWRYANICKKTGHLAGPNCPAWTEPFLPEDVLPPPCSGIHEASQPMGILHPLDDQIFVLDPHRPEDSQSVLLEIRAESDCYYSINGQMHRIPAGGHLRTQIKPVAGSYEITLHCPGKPPVRTLFRISE
ncbi:MAG: transglycosylase domain-containing protein [Leptospiraceae bacterium]